MVLDLFGSRKLLLAGARLGWLWVAAAGVALALLLILYREERRLVSRRAGLGLLGLRLAAGLVLVAALFEPTMARSYREAVKGRVIVAVDVSESMATTDPRRSLEDEQKLAKLLRIKPGESVKALTRREVAGKLISAPGSPIEVIARSHEVEAVTFARSTNPASLTDLAESLKQPGKPDDPGALTTDWQPVLAEALRAGPSDSPVLGIVLLTDGRQNAPRDDSNATADRLARRGIPVYPIVIGSTVPPRDAAVAAVRAPQGIYKGDVATIEATLKLDGYAGREIRVTLDRPNAAPLERRVLVPPQSANARPVVSFSVPMTEAGTFPLTIALEPQEGDARPDNDRRTVPVQVTDDKAAVLLVDGEARWEFRYLRNALARDPQVKLEAVVFHQPETTGVSTKTTYPTAISPGPTSPPKNADAPTDPLGAFDVIILGDVDPVDLPAEAWARLDSYVAERGGTLILSPGPRFGPSLAGNETARKLMPVLAPRPITIEPGRTNPDSLSLLAGSLVVPTPGAIADATAWPMLQLASDPEQSRLLWAGLPRLPWTLVGRPKPGATTLAQLDAEASADESASAVIAAQSYGLGKVLWVGTNSTWRWRYRVGDTYHHRFWGQTVRWGASGKLAAGNAFVRFGPVRPQVAEGEEIRLQARIADGVAGVGPDLLIAARLIRIAPSSGPNQAAGEGEVEGETVAVVPLRPVAGQPRAYEGRTPSLPLGRYRVRLDAPQLADALQLNGPSVPAPNAHLDVVARETSERIELAADRDLPARLATTTRGRLFTDLEADALPPLIQSRTRPTLRTEETPLWDHPAAFVLFIAIITSEWLLRKRAGLP